MKCEFSEMQFVFGLMYEFMSRYQTAGMAWKSLEFPTPRRERDLGYDLRIDGYVRNIFFQFKVPEKKTTSSSKYWETFEDPYYEFEIWPDSRTHQHNELVDLARSDPHNKVYYCSPAFHTREEYGEYYTHQCMIVNSVFVPCQNLIKIKGNDKHDISYTLAPRRNIVMHSQEIHIEGFDVQGLERDIEEAVPYQNVYECLNSVVKKLSRHVSDSNNITQMYHEITDQLLMEKNICMVLLGERPDK